MGKRRLLGRNGMHQEISQCILSDRWTERTSLTQMCTLYGVDYRDQKPPFYFCFLRNNIVLTGQLPFQNTISLFLYPKSQFVTKIGNYQITGTRTSESRRQSFKTYSMGEKVWVDFLRVLFSINYVSRVVRFVIVLERKTSVTKNQLSPNSE